MFNSDFGIDLGTANTLVFAKSRGVIANEPSVIALHQGTRRVLAVGRRAHEMVGRTPGDIVAIRPLRDGVVSDFHSTTLLLRHFLQRTLANRLFKPRVVVGVPCQATAVERRAVADVARSAGAGTVILVDEPLAAAIGSDLPVAEPVGVMVVDIGGGTTDVALISMGGLVAARSIKVAGNEFDGAIARLLKRQHSLVIGERTAERVKVQLGSALAAGRPGAMAVTGRHMASGLPEAVTVEGQEVHAALREPLEQIRLAVARVLEEIPPELLGDVAQRGILLTGGGALLHGLAAYLSAAVGVPVFTGEDPLTAVVRGTGLILQNARTLRLAAFA